MAITQGVNSINSLPSAIISPHEGSGGCTPIPKNESAASKRIACATSKVATTIRLLSMLGIISMIRICGVEQPMALAALTYSILRSCWVLERITTAKRSHIKKPSTQMITVRLPPIRATTASATSTTGMLRRVVIKKLMIMSVRPPKYPAATPRVVPISPDINIAEMPISNEMRAPNISRLR